MCYKCFHSQKNRKNNFSSFQIFFRRGTIFFKFNFCPIIIRKISPSLPSSRPRILINFNVAIKITSKLEEHSKFISLCNDLLFSFPTKFPSSVKIRSLRGKRKIVARLIQNPTKDREWEATKQKKKRKDANGVERRRKAEKREGKEQKDEEIVARKIKRKSAKMRRATFARPRAPS